MAPKGGNAKKESGRAKKAENEVSTWSDCAVPRQVTWLVLELQAEPGSVVTRAAHCKQRANTPQAKKAEAAAAQKEKAEADKWKSGGTSRAS